MDGSYVRDLETDAIDLAIVRSIHDLARAVGAQTIAECVESESTHARLGEIGIDFAQGNAVGRPAPLERLLEPCSPLRPVLKDVSS